MGKLLLFVVTFLARTTDISALPRWSDIFSALEPYKDEETARLEEFGDPRLGFVQLNSGSTAFNATLNLTGHILLGLGIASSVLLYMFFNAFDSAGNSGYGSSGYSRSLHKLPTTGFNATINLTGHIILGLGIASALLMYMFFSAFNRNDYHYYSRYGEYVIEKRSLTVENEAMAFLDEALLQYTDGTQNSSQCSGRIICEAFFVVKGEQKMEGTSNIPDVLKSSFPMRRQECREMWNSCTMGETDIEAVLNLMIERYGEAT